MSCFFLGHRSSPARGQPGDHSCSRNTSKQPGTASRKPGGLRGTVGGLKCTILSSQDAAETQQLSCAEAGEALVSEEDDLEQFLMEITGELEGEIEVDAEKDVDELLLELSDIIDSVTP
ncbi:uncharacterized protein LOC121111805 isoform X1 [Gallus gallus]|uniref:uncharacterized protein LOC121111805 isoform X1 n=1 Tax=Gallus gallus TaxID=9031 RepID=UPI001AE324F1|nr:uncharacterized protein LOC121111805 isoform X1 [Gallus gallus]